MADINKVDVKLMESQRLDDTDQGAGQMTSNVVQDAAVNNLFMDISRFDRVYGRVSLRTAFPSIQTLARQTYQGAHVVMTEQAADPNVFVCFFSSENWFDLRIDQQQRIESYLVKGPQAQYSLWGDHFKGTGVIAFITHENYPNPEVGDVLVLDAGTYEQYVRIIDVTSEIQTFFAEGSFAEYKKKVITISLGTILEYNFAGEEVDQVINTTDDPTRIYTTVAADASRYYGVTKLAEEATSGELQFRVQDIMTNLVPSAASQSSINDYKVGNNASPMISADGQDPVTRGVSYHISAAGKIFLGQGVLPGTLEWSGGVSFKDAGNGNIYEGSDTSNIIGSIHYPTGTISFASTVDVDLTGTGTVTYTPAAEETVVSQTGAIDIETNNRGFIYNFYANPIPVQGSTKVEYMSGGKWYTIWDQGNGQIAGLQNADGSVNTDTGSGSVNSSTGLISVTLAEMPDVGSKIIFYWAKPSRYVDLGDENFDLRYKFSLEHEGITRNTFRLIWLGDATGDGSAGERCIMDDGDANLVEATWNDPNWEPIAVPVTLGNIKYANGTIDVTIPDVIASAGLTPQEVFTIEYNYGEKFEDIFEMPPRDMNGNINLTLTNTPILPGTFEIEWHTDLVEYDPETRLDMTKDPTYIFQDDTAGNFDGDTDDGTPNWEQGSVDYATGDVTFTPDRISVFPIPQYEWVVTDWLHPGVVETRVFTGIEFLSAASLFPTDGVVYCRYCTTDGLNFHTYDGTITPTYIIQESKEMQLMPGSVMLSDGTVNIFDGADGKLYANIDGVTGSKTQVGTVNYATKTVQITGGTINIWDIYSIFALGSADIEPAMSLVFRSPGAPITPGSFIVKGTTQTGRVIIGNSDFSGDITGDGILGHINYNTGLAHVAFGEWVVDDESVEGEDWYTGAPSDGAGNVWKPFVVQAYTIVITCVVTSYIPLDADLIGLDPVRLPMDGRVPIFRDGYVVLLQHPVQDDQNTDAWDDVLQSPETLYASRQNVSAIEVYELPTTYDVNEGNLTTGRVITELTEEGFLNFTVDLVAGSVTFSAGYEHPTDANTPPKRRTISILSVNEDMCLASDVQITGHIAVTSQLTHDYPAEDTTVSSVLPLGDMQSRAYNEFEQSGWSGVWSNIVAGTPPIASYDFVNYPITVINKSCTKERWLIKFTSSTQVQIVGENIGVLAENITVIDGGGVPEGLLIWDGVSTGAYKYNNIPCLVCGNRQFPGGAGEDGSPFWVIDLEGFGLGWASGNCIRFNTDAANYPVTFVRTTLQAPAGEEPNDHYTMQIRGDSS